MQDHLTYYGNLLGYGASAVALIAATVALFVRWRNHRDSTYFLANGFHRFDHRRARQRYIPHTLVPLPDLNGCELIPGPIRFDELLEQFERDDRPFPGIVLVKGGTGTGKTTLLLRIHHSYFNVFRRPMEVLFPGHVGRRVVTFRLNSTVHLDTIARLNAQEQEAARTILLLDGLDELHLDQGLPFTERFDHVRSITANFRGVIITCRSQDMSREQLKLTSDLEYEHLVSLTDPVERRCMRDAREVGIMAIRPFTEHEIEAYLDRAFPWYRFMGKARAHAEELLAVGNKTSQRLGVPMVLAFLKEIVNHPDFEKNRYSTAAIVGQIVDRWMLREAEKASGASDRKSFIQSLRTTSEAMGYAHVLRDTLVVGSDKPANSTNTGVQGWRPKVKYNALLDRVYGLGASEVEKWVFVHRIFRDYFAACHIKAIWDKGERLRAIERDFYHAPDAEAFLTELNRHKPIPTMPVSFVKGGTYMAGPTEKEREQVERIHSDPSGFMATVRLEEMRQCTPRVSAVADLRMAKTTTTMRQFRAFLTAATGYDQSRSILKGSYVWTGRMNDDVLSLTHKDHVDATWGIRYTNGQVRALPNGPEEDHPVMHVSILDMVAYCNWLSREAQLKEVYRVEDHYINVDLHCDGYRLPTAQEWEYAAREGIHQSNFLFAGSDDAMLVANFYQRYGLEPGFTYQELVESSANTIPVRSLMPNRLDLYDMSGNVQELVWGLMDGFIEWGHPVTPDRIDTDHNTHIQLEDFTHAMCSKGGSLTYAMYIGELDPDSIMAGDSTGFRVMRLVASKGGANK
ncbi:MAG: SUMF1/EgtB/PvdO family nonheme iron enzyme [Flavobacteriales bacterium]|nr:SUMF1/EgtB/PvdO family nonheme iron enzyme [Flavobacteriales bacterium]